MTRSTTLLKLAAIAVALALGSSAHASVLWSATSTSSFKGLEEQDCDGNYHSDNGSSVTEPVSNEFKFHKVSDDRRCEGKGASGLTIDKNSKTYYIGWRFKISNTVNNNSIFQWKAYGSPMTQNYPFVIKMINGKLTVEHYPGGGSRVNLFDVSISANTWYHIVLKIKTSTSTTGGEIQVWYNGGGAETLKTGGTVYKCKTFDGSSIEPKWGIYGACNSTIDSYVKDLKIGTTFGDVDFE